MPGMLQAGSAAMIACAGPVGAMLASIRLRTVPAAMETPLRAVLSELRRLGMRSTWLSAVFATAFLPRSHSSGRSLGQSPLPAVPAAVLADGVLRGGGRERGGVSVMLRTAPPLFLIFLPLRLRQSFAGS